MLEQLGVSSIKDGSDLVVLDQACGTGVVADRLYKLFPDAGLNLTCTDYSGAMLNLLESRAEKNGWKGLRTQQCDAQVCLSLYRTLS